MSQGTKKKRVAKSSSTSRDRENVSKMVDAVGSNLPLAEKLRMQAIIARERGKYTQALSLVKSGLREVLTREVKIKKSKNKKEANDNSINIDTLLLIKARLYFENGQICRNLNLLPKAVASVLQSLNIVKTLLDSGNIEVLQFRELLALCYRDLKQRKEAMSQYNQILFSLSKIINKSMPPSLPSHVNTPLNTRVNAPINKEKIGLLQWKAKICYEIAMILNHTKSFKEAEIMARQCLEIVTLYQSCSEMHVLSCMLLAVIISSPNIEKYEESLDTLKTGKDICEGKYISTSQSTIQSSISANSQLQQSMQQSQSTMESTISANSQLQSQQSNNVDTDVSGEEELKEESNVDNSVTMDEKLRSELANKHLERIDGLIATIIRVWIRYRKAHGEKRISVSGTPSQSDILSAILESKSEQTDPEPNSDFFQPD